eukprot:scaffold1541_cov418-Prasinococcus_capsulatus_cf.AAC.9
MTSSVGGPLRQARRVSSARPLGEPTVQPASQPLARSSPPVVVVLLRLPARTRRWSRPRRGPSGLGDHLGHSPLSRAPRERLPGPAFGANRRARPMRQQQGRCGARLRHNQGRVPWQAPKPGDRFGQT